MTIITKAPAPEPWAMDALRELVDIAGLLNDEMFIAIEGLSARTTIIQRLQALAEALTLDTGEPQVEYDPLPDQEDDEGRDYSGFSDDIYFPNPISSEAQETES